MKMSEVRAKFPQYADVPDDQLLIALHKKFYSDLPAAKFFGGIERDTERAQLQKEAASSGSWGERALANVGAGLTTTGQGIKQLLPEALGGGVSDEAIREKRALDKPLAANTAGGGALQAVGESAPLLAIPGAGLVAGAAAGAAGGALQPVTSDESRLQNATVGGLAGGVLGKVFPYAMQAAGKGISSLRNAVGGNEAVVQRMLQEAARGEPQALKQLEAHIASNPDIPLSGAAAARSAGLARLEAAQRAKNPAAFVPLDQAHGAAVFKKTLDATKAAPDIEALRAGRKAEWESNWKTAMDVADPQVFAQQLPKFRADLDRALLSTESSNPAVRNVVNEIRSEMDRLGPNFTPGHLQQIRANLNARGSPMPRDVFGSAPRESAAVDSLIGEMDSILNKTTNGAWDAVKGGYEASTKGVNEAKAAARVRGQFLDEGGRVRKVSVDPQGEVPQITESGMGRALDSTKDKAGREMLAPEARAALEDTLGAIRQQGIVARTNRTATAGGGSATEPNRLAGAAMDAAVPGASRVLDWFSKAGGGERDQLLANALRDPEALRNYLSKEPSITTKATTFAGDVLERERVKKLVDALRGQVPYTPSSVLSNAPRAFGTAAGVDLFEP